MTSHMNHTTGQNTRANHFESRNSSRNTNFWFVYLSYYSCVCRVFVMCLCMCLCALDLLFVSPRVLLRLSCFALCAFQDLMLYEHFNKTFWRKVEAFGRERMERSVKALRMKNKLRKPGVLKELRALLSPPPPLTSRKPPESRLQTFKIGKKMRQERMKRVKQFKFKREFKALQRQLGEKFLREPAVGRHIKLIRRKELKVLARIHQPTERALKRMEAQIDKLDARELSFCKRKTEPMSLQAYTLLVQKQEKNLFVNELVDHMVAGGAGCYW